MKKYNLILISFILFGCQFNRYDDTMENEDSLHYYSGEFRKRIAASLNLSNIESSDDSLEIRIWSHTGVKRYGQLIVIKKNYLGWNCFVYQYLEKHNSNPFEIEIDTFDVEKRIPKSGWTVFLSQIEHYGIYDMPDQDDIKDWRLKDISDGTTYAIEYIRKGEHRIYHYHCPDLYLEYSNSRQMINLLNFLRQEIDFNEGDIPVSLRFEIKQQNQNSE